MIHGKTKIELYNPNTKIKQIIREENTFQNSVLQNYFKSNGIYNTNPFLDSNFRGRDTWINIVGGILLFKNSIDISGGAVPFMPSGNQMVGNGSYEVSNGSSSSDPSEMGSWNASESSASSSAITQVYDWATDQGNGTIGSICLTSRVGGYIGYGNASGKYKGLMSMYQDQSSNGMDGGVSNDGAIQYHIRISNGHLVVQKAYIGASSMSVFNGFAKESSFDIEEIGDDIWGLANASNTDYQSYYTDIIDGKIRFVPNVYGTSGSSRNVAPSGEYYFYEYDIANDTMSLKHFTNSSTKTLRDYNNSRFNLPYSGLFFGNNVVCVLSSTDNTVLFFNYLTGELLHSGNYVWNEDYFPCELSDGLIQLAQSGANPMYILDMSSWTSKIVNANGQTVGKRLRINGDYLLVNRISSNIFANPLYLATINNLQSPVTKTAAQTMKVTYTLTEE